jgi:hypothetical protein
MLSWEGQAFQGGSTIIEKLTVRIHIFLKIVSNGIHSVVQSLPFQKVQHKVTTQDAQPVPPIGNIIVLVTGLLLVRVLAI